MQRSIVLSAVAACVLATGVPVAAVAATSGSPARPATHWSARTPATSSPTFPSDLSAGTTAQRRVGSVAPGSSTARVAPHADGDAPRGAFAPLNPARLLDTRPGRTTVDGKGAGVGALGAGRVLPLQVTGRDDIPSGAVAVVVTVIAVGATAPTYVTAYPHGATRPTASSLISQKGQTTSVATTVGLSSGGALDLYNYTGTTNLIVDVTGYYSAAGDPNGTSGFRPQPPARLYDSRTNKDPLQSDYFAAFEMSIAQTTAVALNITAINPGAAGYLTVDPGDDPEDVSTSPVDFAAHQTVGDMVVVPTDDDENGNPSFSVVNISGKPVDFTVDIVGYYVPTTYEASYLVPLATPKRIVDSRHGIGIAKPLGQGGTAAVATSSSFGDAATIGITGTVTGLDDRYGTYVTLYPTGASAPATASVDVEAHGTRANMAMTGLGAEDGKAPRALGVLNGIGTADVLVDVSGYFDDPDVKPQADVSLSSPTSSAAQGTPVTFTATVFGIANEPAPTGTVEFGLTTDEDSEATVPIGPDGTASWTTTTLPVGDDQVISVYDGDSTYSPSPSNTVDVTITDGTSSSAPAPTTSAPTDPSTSAAAPTSSAPAPTSSVPTPSATSTPSDSLALAVSRPEVATDAAEVLTATVTTSTGKTDPSQRVRFVDTSNGSILGTSAVVDGVATLTERGLAPGSRSIVAEFPSNIATPFLVSSVVPVTVDVGPSRAVTVGQSATHDGADPTDAFAPATLHRVWQDDLGSDTAQYQPGIGLPLAAGGRVFAIVSDGGGEPSVDAYDAATGAALWSTPIARRLPFSPDGIAYDGGQVYELDGGDLLHAYDAATGGEEWSTQLPQPFGGAAPVAYDGVVYATGTESGGTLSAVSEATGELLWNGVVENGADGVVAVDDSGVYVGEPCDQSSRFLQSGVLSWSASYPCGTGGGGSTPVRHGSDDYLTYGDRIATADDGRQVGSFTATGLPAFDAISMYAVVSGALVASDSSGTVARWTYTPASSATVTGPVVTTPHMIITPLSDGSVVGVDPLTGAQVWSSAATGATTVAAADGLLFASGTRYLTAYANGSSH